MKGVSMIRASFAPEAICAECPWESRGYAVKVRSGAQRHVKDTGHTVRVDVLDRTSYSPEVAR